jgi:phytoene synthase
MTGELERSYQHCRKVARARARNFYYGFWLLPKPRRDAFCAVYAFMRYCDDVADGEAAPPEKAARLGEWRKALDAALRGEYREPQILPAFHDAVRRYAIPPEYLHDLVSGTEMDLTIRSYRTFEDLYQYCYRVASVVGLCSLHMMGFVDAQAKPLAERCGVAFQLTNILRDVREDALAGRVYIPADDLQRFGCAPEHLAATQRSRELREVLRFEIARARGYYDDCARLIELVMPESRPALWTLVTIYRRLLGAVARDVEAAPDHYAAVIGRNGSAGSLRRASLSGIEKAGVVVRAAAMRLQLQMGGKPDWRLDA